MARDTSFSYSFLVLPDEQRRAIGVVWDFCRAVDDAVDEAVDRKTAEAEVAGWRQEIERLFGSGAPQTPQGTRLKPSVTAFRLSRSTTTSGSGTSSSWALPETIGSTVIAFT